METRKNADSPNVGRKYTQEETRNLKLRMGKCVSMTFSGPAIGSIGGFFYSFIYKRSLLFVLPFSLAGGILNIQYRYYVTCKERISEYEAAVKSLSDQSE